MADGEVTRSGSQPRCKDGITLQVKFGMLLGCFSERMWKVKDETSRKFKLPIHSKESM